MDGMEIWMDGQTDEPTERWIIDRWVDKQMDEWMWMDCRYGCVNM